MDSLLKTLVRKHDLKKHRSKVRSGLVPLSRIKSAAVFLDGTRPDSSALMDRVRRYFSGHGIKVTICCTCFTDSPMLSEGSPDTVFIHNNDIHWTGRQKRDKKVMPIPEDSDLIVSLLYPDPYVCEYAVLCSDAKFKVGRTRLKSNAYDFTLICDDLDQNQALDAVCEVLEKVQ